MLTIVIPSYNLVPVLGPLSLLPEVCESIREWAVVLSMADVNSHLQGLECLSYSYSVAHDPLPSEIRRIRNKNMPGLAVWYSAVVTPVFRIGPHARQRMEHCSRISKSTSLDVMVLFDVTEYISMASEIMDVDSPPTDFNTALLSRTMNGLQDFIASIRESGRLAGIDSYRNHSLRSLGLINGDKR